MDTQSYLVGPNFSLRLDQHPYFVCVSNKGSGEIGKMRRLNLIYAVSTKISWTDSFVFGDRYSKTCVKGPLSKRPQIGFQDQLSLTAGQKYCRMLCGEYSAILSTFIKLPFVSKIFVLSIFEWPFYTSFTVSLYSWTMNLSIK